MKKYFLFLSISLTSLVNVVCPMDLVQRSEHDQKKYDKKCDRVARYFVKHLPDMKLQDAFSNFCNLDKPVKRLILDYGASKKSSLMMLVCMPRDIFMKVVACGLPCYEKKGDMQLVIPQGYQYKNGYAEQGSIIIGAQSQVINRGDDVEVSTASAMQKLFDLPVVEALSVLSRYSDRRFYVKDRFEAPSNVKDSLGGLDFYDPFDEDPSKEYSCSLEEIIAMTPEQQELLQVISQSHMNGLYDTSTRHRITKEELALLVPIKDLIDKNELFSKLLIAVDCEPAKNWEKVTDTVLHSVPLFLVSGVIPEGIHGAIDGKLQGLVGMVPAYFGSFFVGKYMYPIFDMGNSASRKTSEWFGSSNKTKVEKRWSFGALGLMHYMFTCLANKCLDCGSTPLRVIGYSLYGIRGIAFICGTFDLRSYCRKSWTSIFPGIFTLKKYNDVLSRRNKDDKSYTLGDLLNSPMASKL